LFNRGSRPDDVDANVPTVQRDQERAERLTSDFAKLALATIIAETIARLHTSFKHATFNAAHLISLLGIVILELAVQHAVTTALAMATLRWKGWYPSDKFAGHRHRDGRREYFA